MSRNPYQIRLSAQNIKFQAQYLNQKHKAQRKKNTKQQQQQQQCQVPQWKNIMKIANYSFQEGVQLTPDVEVILLAIECFSFFIFNKLNRIQIQN